MKLLIVVFFVFANLANGQTPWEKIYEDESSTILLNSAKIIGYGNEVSVWAIEEFTEPKSSENGDEVFKTKTHYLFNKMKRKYAEVGVIYYDKYGKIINRASKSNFNGSSSAFMISIKSNPSVEIIYKEAVSFLITNKIRAIDETKTESNSQVEAVTMNREPVTMLDETEAIEDKKIEIEATENDDKIDVEETNKNAKIVIATPVIGSEDDEIDLSKEPWNEIPKIEKNGDISEKPNVESLASNEPKEFDKIKIDLPSFEKDKSQHSYNSENERALANSIFTDGNLYCIQVSSWKTRAYADRELKKLLNDGFDAFIVSVKPANKRSIWNRVRVGYFSSLAEAKAVKKKIGKR